MMSNDKASLPQYGINRADIVYEAPVEGGMNRYMAIIENYDDLDRIGSVRSCRTYYTYFAREFDAIYAHYGRAPLPSRIWPMWTTSTGWMESAPWRITGRRTVNHLTTRIPAENG